MTCGSGATARRVGVRYGIIGDIHGNLEALTAVLDMLKQEGAVRHVCLGDIVGYGADPVSCISRVRELDAICVAGNHDYAAIGQTPVDYFNPHARHAVMWTREQLGQKERDFLTEMPLMRKLDGFTLVHASPEAPAEWNYLYHALEAARSFQVLDTHVCFIGHSHIPVTFVSNGSCGTRPPEDFTVSHSKRYLVNTGSVGQPRDGDPRASCCIFDTASGLVQVKRVGYDINAAQAKIIAAGLPPVLALRLARGE